MFREEIPEGVMLEWGRSVAHKIIRVLRFAGAWNIFRRFRFLDHHVTGKSLRENLEIFFELDGESNRVICLDESRKNEESANRNPAEMREPFVTEDHRKIDDRDYAKKDEE